MYGKMLQYLSLLMLVKNTAVVFFFMLVHSDELLTNTTFDFSNVVV